MVRKAGDSKPIADERHFRQSVQREKLVEHLFTGLLLRHFWRSNMDVDLLRPEVDRLGYDIVVSHGKITRHIQLKASILGGKASAQTISAGLAQHPSGCVIWMVVDKDLEFRAMLWFGGKPGRSLPDLNAFPHATRTTPNSEGMKPVRENTRRIKRSAFDVIQGEDLLPASRLGSSVRQHCKEQLTQTSPAASARLAMLRRHERIETASDAAPLQRA